ncbi:MAG TPA: hypothetical protein V6D14_04625 [Coleofasciculaceae cyanobacterium]|jgi:hypothetical protein
MVLATLAAQSLNHQALATSDVNITDPPQTKKAGDLVVESPKEAAIKEATLKGTPKAIASPESLTKQEFAPKASSQLANAQSVEDAQKVAVPSAESPTPKSTSTGTVPQATSTGTVPQATSAGIAPPEIAPPETDTKLRSNVQVSTGIQGNKDTRNSRIDTPRYQVQDSPRQVPQLNASEVTLERTSAQKNSLTSVEPSAAPQVASAKTLAELQSHSARDLLAVPTSKQSTGSINTPTSQETITPQPTTAVTAQGLPAISPQPTTGVTPQGVPTISPQPTTGVTPQGVPTISPQPTTGVTSPNAPITIKPCPEVDALLSQLRGLEQIKAEGAFQASPSLSIVIPTGFGADNNTGFVSATFQQRTRYGDVSDGGLGFGVGLGDARKSVGVELSYTLASFGGSRDFGAGGFNIKVHRQLPNDFAVAVGWNGFLNVGGQNDFENSVYGTVTKVIRTRDDINLPFSRVAVTAGVGSGQFRSESAVANNSGGVNVFGNVAVRVAQPVSLIAEWSGQDLGVGLSIAPFKNIPLVITPAVRDIAGAGDGPRFVLGTGFAFKF